MKSPACSGPLASQCPGPAARRMDRPGIALALGGARRAAAARVRWLRRARRRRAACSARRCEALVRADRGRRVPALSAPPRGRGRRARAIAPLDAAVAAVWLEPPVIGLDPRVQVPAARPARTRAGPARRGRRARGALRAARAGARARSGRAGAAAPAPAARARLQSGARRRARRRARASRAPLAATALERVRDTPSQTGLNAAARRRNVRGAMRARRAVPARVWIVDDVITTGATLREAARALRAAGARSR